MQRTFLTLVTAAFITSAPGLALAEGGGGNGPAGGAFMSSYSTPPAAYVQPYAAPSSAFAVQSEPRENASPQQQRRRSRGAS